LYRSRRGAILGVCRGIAEYFNFSVFWARTIAVIVLIFTGFWPVTGLYLLAALLMKPEPVIPIRNNGEQEFYDSYTHSRPGAVQRIKRRFDRLERRIRRMEHIVTSPDYDWDDRMKG
jgi:phage shock protein C